VTELRDHADRGWSAGILLPTTSETAKVRITRSPIVAVLLALALIVQPGVVMACAMPVPDPGAGPEQSIVTERGPATPQAAPVMDDRPPVKADAAEDIDSARALVAVKLVELGFTAEEARQAAIELTDDDIAVLLENERMMQRAGDLSNLGAAYLIGTLIVVGIVILAANGSGFVNIN
jgi:hypothetical protein